MVTWSDGCVVARHGPIGGVGDVIPSGSHVRHPHHGVDSSFKDSVLVLSSNTTVVRVLVLNSKHLLNEGSFTINFSITFVGYRVSFVVVLCRCCFCCPRHLLLQMYVASGMMHGD
jgi:hypothetical protein